MTFERDVSEALKTFGEQATLASNVIIQLNKKIIELDKRIKTLEEEKK